jgi:hypothetical protein
MIQAVLFIIIMIGVLGWPSSIYVFRRFQGLPPSRAQQLLMVACFLVAASSSLAVWLLSMRAGVRALEKLAG